MKMNATLVGHRPVLFNRYAGDNNTQLPPEEKMYIEDGILTLPAQNLYSCLAAENTKSVAKKFYGRKWQDVATPIMTYLEIDPFVIPFLDGPDGEPIRFEGFNNKVTVEEHIARIKTSGGVVPFKVLRPCLHPPWALKVEFTVEDGQTDLTPELLRVYMKQAGKVGICSFRPVFGRFETIWQD